MLQVEVQAVLVETSEEVRLQLMQFMHAVLKQAPRLIQAFASDVASILVAATFDKHPEVLLVSPSESTMTFVCKFQCKWNNCWVIRIT